MRVMNHMRVLSDHYILNLSESESKHQRTVTLCGYNQLIIL